jgi:RES domain-containing protein
VYAAQSLSLAQLEVLVHIPDRRQMPFLVCGEADVPEDVPMEIVGPERLPHDWRRFAPDSPGTQRIGAEWLARQSSAVLRVPSAISTGEWNVLLNPAHPDFTRIELRSITVFTMDPRLK